MRGDGSGLEIDIENKVVELAWKELGVPSLKLNVQGNTGWPDRVFWVPGGKPLLIEFKQPGEKPNPKQVMIHELLRYRGYNVQVHDTIIEAFQAVQAALADANASRPEGPSGSKRRAGSRGPAAVEARRVHEEGAHVPRRTRLRRTPA